MNIENTDYKSWSNKIRHTRDIREIRVFDLARAERCIFKQEQQKFEAVLVISDDENENSTYQLKEDMIHLPEHPKQVFKTEVRQE